MTTHNGPDRYAQSTVMRSGMGDAVMTMDAHGCITSVNPVAEALTGWRRDEAEGLSSEVVFRIAAHDGGQLENPVRRALQAKTALQPPDAAMLTAKLGATQLVDYSVSRMHDAGGVVSGVVLVFRSAVVFRRNVVHARPDDGLATSEVRYRRLFETAQDGILILDATSLTIIDANRFMSELLGYSREDLMGKELWQIGFSRDKLASQALYRELQEQGYVRYDHLPLETRNGQSAEVEFISNVYDMGDRRVAQCNIRDISARSRLERKLQEQTDALTELHRRKDEFLAMLSHELRNPLAPISNAVHLLQLQSGADPVQRRAHEIIERQVIQLGRLVDDLMEVSRITTGQVELRLETVAINDVVESALETTRPLTTQRHQDVTVSPSSPPIWIRGDAARLEQVMVNLITNAAKYTDEYGQIRVRVSLQAAECVLSVEDTGIGIDAHMLPRVFDLFTQAPASLDRARGGLGIGLALVDRLVKMHNGSVSVTSVMGRGSIFVVRLPVSAPPEAIAPITQGRVRGRAGASGVRVLVVDDNVDTAETLALVVKAFGHDVHRVNDGHSVVKAALGQRPHVVLLDIGLPGIDGYEIARQLRREPVLEGIVLVAITGYGHETDRQRARAAGFDHHLVKPPDFARLRTILAAASNRLDVRA
jgi:PAS domain S-box-containing protein